MAGKVKQLPKLPLKVFTTLGYVDVGRKDIIPDDEGKPSAAFGEVDFHTRTVNVRNGLAREAEWVTLFHEQIHLLLHDAGVCIEEELEEIVCDVIATGRVAEMKARLTKEN